MRGKNQGKKIKERQPVGSWINGDHGSLDSRTYKITPDWSFGSDYMHLDFADEVKPYMLRLITQCELYSVSVSARH
jgi:hypothetical protein